MPVGNSGRFGQYLTFSALKYSREPLKEKTLKEPHIDGVINKTAGQASMSARDARETIESGPQRITDLFKNKSVAYFLFITAFI